MLRNIKVKNCNCNTDGKGFWSNAVKLVTVNKLEVRSHEDEDADDNYRYNFGELRIYFTKSSWNIDKLGLIYTDNLFIKEFRKYLKTNYNFSNKAVKDIDYSEQGMQGYDYVSCDVGKAFLKEWNSIPEIAKQIVFS